MIITDERLAELAAEDIEDAIRDLIQDRMGQAERLSDEDGFETLSETEVDALCDRYEDALRKHLPDEEEAK